MSFWGIAASTGGVNLETQRSLMAELAQRSGEFIRPYFGNPDLRVEMKPDETPVTAADTGAEELMRRMIEERFPEHGIMGEERGTVRPGADFMWVLDPIDGTKAFTAAVPLFGTLIALLHEGQPVLGCIHQPVTGELVMGDNRTTTLNGRVVRARGPRRLEDATLLTTDMAALMARPDCGGYLGLMGRARVSRTWGDCYGHLLVATGRADANFDPVMNLWDIAALVPVVRGSGGVITDRTGGPAYPASSTLSVSSPELHRLIVGRLAQA